MDYTSDTRRSSGENNRLEQGQETSFRRSISTRRQRDSDHPESSTAPARQTQSSQNRDLEQMGRYSRDRTMPQPMRNIMAELYQVGTRTDLYPDAGGAAFASRKFRNETFANHEVRYHGEADKEEVDRIGNLTHELTHVSVQDKFDKDYVNYTNPPPGPVDAPTFNPNAERMQNEEDRQRQQSVSSADNAIQVKLENLQKLTLKDGCLNQEQRNQVREKLTYGIQSPHIEFDTVINQILTWLYHWGVTSDKSKLARELSNVAAQNQKERISQNRIVASTKKKPTFKPATQAIGEKPSSWKDKFRKS